MWPDAPLKQVAHELGGYNNHNKTTEIPPPGLSMQPLPQFFDVEETLFVIEVPRTQVISVAIRSSVLLQGSHGLQLYAERGEEQDGLLV